VFSAVIERPREPRTSFDNTRGRQEANFSVRWRTCFAPTLKGPAKQQTQGGFPLPRERANDNTVIQHQSNGQAHSAHGRQTTLLPGEPQTTITAAAANSSPLPPLLVNSRDAARMLAISEKTLWNITEPRGTLRCVRPPEAKRVVRYAVADLLDWIARTSETTMTQQQ
jgi:hypothetical protein